MSVLLLRHETLDVRRKTLDVRCQTWEMSHQTWDITQESSDVKHQTWDMRCKIWDIRHAVGVRIKPGVKSFPVWDHVLKYHIFITVKGEAFHSIQDSLSLWMKKWWRVNRNAAASIFLSQCDELKRASAVIAYRVAAVGVTEESGQRFRSAVFMKSPAVCVIESRPFKYSSGLFITFLLSPTDTYF